VTFDFSSFGNNELPDQIQVFEEKSQVLKLTMDIKANSLNDRKLQIDTHDLPRGTYDFHVIKSDNARQKVEKMRVILE
jgi:lysyl endopeptidase